MIWATSETIHFDRVVSAWLILRFVDEDAEFVFLKAGEEPGEGVNAFGLRGVKLAAHDEGGTTVSRILENYGLRSDPALELMGRIVQEGVDHVLGTTRQSGSMSRHPAVLGTLWITEGAMLMARTDAECLERSIPLYDQLYARLSCQQLVDDRAPSPPATVLQQTLLMSAAQAKMRGEGTPWSVAAFSTALAATRLD